MGAFKSLYPLPAKAIAAAGNASIELLGLPLSARVAGFLLEIRGTGTAASSTSAVTPVDLAKLIATVDFDSDFFFCRATGKMLHALDRLMGGAALTSSAQSVTTSTGGEAVRSFLYIPLADMRARKPFDTAVPVRLLREKTINIQFKSTLALGLSPDVTVSAATLYPYAVLVPEKGDVLPTRSRIAFEDWAQATANLRGGNYTHLGIYDESDLSVTDAQYAQISAGFDGQQIIDRTLTSALIARYNAQVPRDAAQELSYQAAAAIQFIPIVCQPDKYSVLDCPRGANVRVDLDSGTSAATGGRFFYRMVEETGENEGRDAAVRLGHNPDNVKVSTKTDSKVPPQGAAERVARINRLLPKRLHR